MKKITILLIMMFSVNAYSMDLNSIKVKLRSFSSSFLNQETVEMIFGKEEIHDPIPMPEVNFESGDAKDVSVYSKNAPIYNQGGSFHALSEVEKNKYHLVFIEELFSVVKGEEPTEEDLTRFINVLSQGGTREGIYRNITLDGNYNRLENSKVSLDDETTEFIIFFGEKYLSRAFTEESLGKANFYYVKRVLSEFSLEALDSLALKSEDVYSWYANFSFDLASKYDGAWDQKIRKNNDIQFHYDWAKEVPFELIKSEVLIKLNKILNHLNR